MLCRARDQTDEFSPLHCCPSSSAVQAYEIIPGTSTKRRIVRRPFRVSILSESSRTSRLRPRLRIAHRRSRHRQRCPPVSRIDAGGARSAARRSRRISSQSTARACFDRRSQRTRFRARRRGAPLGLLHRLLGLGEHVSPRASASPAAEALVGRRAIVSIQAARAAPRFRRGASCASRSLSAVSAARRRSRRGANSGAPRRRPGSSATRVPRSPCWRGAVDRAPSSTQQWAVNARPGEGELDAAALAERGA